MLQNGAFDIVFPFVCAHLTSFSVFSVSPHWEMAVPVESIARLDSKSGATAVTTEFGNYLRSAARRAVPLAIPFTSTSEGWKTALFNSFKSKPVRTVPAAPLLPCIDRSTAPTADTKRLAITENLKTAPPKKIPAPKPPISYSEFIALAGEPTPLQQARSASQSVSVTTTGTGIGTASTRPAAQSASGDLKSSVAVREFAAAETLLAAAASVPLLSVSIRDDTILYSDAVFKDYLLLSLPFPTTRSHQLRARNAEAPPNDSSNTKQQNNSEKRGEGPTRFTLSVCGVATTESPPLTVDIEHDRCIAVLSGAKLIGLIPPNPERTAMWNGTAPVSSAPATKDFIPPFDSVRGFSFLPFAAKPAADGAETVWSLDAVNDHPLVQAGTSAAAHTSVTDSKSALAAAKSHAHHSVLTGTIRSGELVFIPRGWYVYVWHPPLPTSTATYALECRPPHPPATDGRYANGARQFKAAMKTDATATTSSEGSGGGGGSAIRRFAALPDAVWPNIVHFLRISDVACSLSRVSVQLYRSMDRDVIYRPIFVRRFTPNLAITAPVASAVAAAPISTATATAPDPTPVPVATTKSTDTKQPVPNAPPAPTDLSGFKSFGPSNPQSVAAAASGVQSGLDVRRSRRTEYDWCLIFARQPDPVSTFYGSWMSNRSSLPAVEGKDRLRMWQSTDQKYFESVLNDTASLNYKERYKAVLACFNDVWRTGAGQRLISDPRI